MNEDFSNSWEAPAAPVQGDSAASKQYPAVKQIVTIRLDVDMLSWFKAEGPGYQTRINQVLRDHMAASTKNQA
ncbi:MAG: BrnA antitoxin family protein [Pseudomonadota bacterium]